MTFRSNTLRACALFLIACSTLVACSDDNDKPVADTGGNDAVSEDASTDLDADVGVDADLVDMGPDLPPAEFFGDGVLEFFYLDEELPGLFFVDYSLKNNGPDALVIETCTWEAVQESTSAPVADGSFSFCRDCNPIAAGERVTYSQELKGIGESPGDGLVPVKVSLTCLPEPNYEDTNPTNNTIEFMINW